MAVAIWSANLHVLNSAVVAIFVVVAWWIGSVIEADLSGVIALPAELGFVHETTVFRPLVGYQPPALATERGIDDLPNAYPN